MNKRKILNSFVSIGSYNEFVSNILLLSELKKSSYVCVCNVHMILEAKKDERFNSILNNADITTPDGMPVAKILSWKYKINQARVAGMDLLPTLINECSKNKKSIFLYGSTDHVLSNIVKRAKSTFPNLNIQYYSPPFKSLTFQEESKVIDMINDHNPDFVFVALGCPKQEKWMFKNKDKIFSCMIGLGGAFEVYAGLRNRAPKWMSMYSLEWFYRLLLEPRRLFLRYFITNSLFIWYICKGYIKNFFK